MNNFANSNFNSANSTFCQNKSFNNYVNLNLLKSERFNGNYENFLKKNNKKIFPENNSQTLEKERIKRNVGKMIRDVDDAVRDSYFRKFDNITFKTIHNKHNVQAKDLDKFLLNFDYAY